MISNFQSPGEIAFSIFSFPIYYYGIFLALAIGVGVWLADFLYRKYYDGESHIFDFIHYVILLGIVGARLYYCLVNYSYYFSNPLEIFNVRQGGLSIHGMIIVGIVSLFVFSKIYKNSFLKLADVFLCATAFSQSIGRWGNFFNSEAFGYPTNLPWKIFIPLSQRPVEYLNYDFFHPTFLYESILDFCIFLVLLYILKRRVKAGTVACVYLVLYAVVRIFVEYFRIDSCLSVFGFPIAQVVSVLMLLAGISGIAFLNRKKI